jgi:hypothetical protein
MSYIADAEVAKAEAVLEPYNAAITSIRSNGDLSDQGRVTALARAYVEAEDAMVAVRESRAEVKLTNKADLVREIFGSAGTSGADAISARDADDRASQLDGGREASVLLERAEANGDTVLARAIAQKAYSEGHETFGGGDWSDVLDAYVTKRPELAVKIQELNENQRHTAGMAIHSGFIFNVVKPAELERWSMTDIRGTAANPTIE